MEANAIYLDFDLGSDADAHRQLFDRLVRLGGGPKETVILQGAPGGRPRYTISIPINLKSQLADYGLPSFRLLDELDVEPCSVELKRVIAHAAEDGTIRTGDRAEPSAWTAVATGYQPSCPNRMDLHHIVTIPKRGKEPPIAVPPSWSMLADPNAWRFRSTKPMNGDADIAALFRRDSAKLASIFKKAGADDIDISMVVEQVIACWTHPLQLTEENSYRVSIKRWTGVSARSLPNIAGICGRIYEKREEKPLAANGTERAAIVADIEPFRRVAIMQGLHPLVMGLGLTPVSAGPSGLRFADYLCTEGAAYASTKQEADSLLEVYGNAIWTLSHSPYSPMLSHPRAYEHAFFWWRILPAPKRLSRNGGRRNGKPEGETVIAAGQQVFSVAPLRQFKRVEDTIIDSMAELLVEKFQLQNAGILGVPFRTSLNAGGGFHAGCLFALLLGPELNATQLQHLAACESILLHRAVLTWPDPAAAPAAAAEEVDKTHYAQTRIQMALDHDKIWNALERVCPEPAQLRVKKLAKEFPEVLHLISRYPELKMLKKDLEANAGFTKLVQSCWELMGGGSMRSLYRWREEAGLPKRRKN